MKIEKNRKVNVVQCGKYHDSENRKMSPLTRNRRTHTIVTTSKRDERQRRRGTTENMRGHEKVSK